MRVNKNNTLSPQKRHRNCNHENARSGRMNPMKLPSPWTRDRLSLSLALFPMNICCNYGSNQM